MSTPETTLLAPKTGIRSRVAHHSNHLVGFGVVTLEPSVPAEWIGAAKGLASQGLIHVDVVAYLIIIDQ